MRPPLARWSPRRMLAIGAAGLAIEAVLIGIMFTLLVRPDPPLVDRLQGRRASSVEVFYSYSGDSTPDTSARVRPPVAAPIAEEDSFYTVLHWPLNKPLLAGGGRVVTLPMRLWWIPVLYVAAVPLLLIGTTLAWLWSRRRAHGAGPAA